MPSKQSEAAAQTRRDKSGTADGGWYESMLGIMYVVSGTVQFADDWDHWRNAFCRLLEIEESKAKALIENTVAYAKEKYGKLLTDLKTDERIACLTEATNRTL